MQFIVKKILPQNIEKEIENIGFSPSYQNYGILKHKFLNLKICNLKPEAATIIKQTALASNCDAAVHKDVLGCKISSSDIILSGTIKELEIVAEKLKLQQFSLNKLSKEILKQINLVSETPINTSIMGILNVTENSFSDGGEYLTPENAIYHGLSMIKEGADIIDIGAESTKPGAQPVSSEIEINRLTPIVKKLRENSKILISIDTRNADTANVMADLGANIINDVSGLNFDPNMAKIIAEKGLEVVITHSRGTPETMANFTDYKNFIDDVYFELTKSIEKALDAGVQPEKIIIDPGFGFAKNKEQNFELLKRIQEFKSLGFRLLCGVSRKSFIQSMVKDKNNNILDDLSALASFYLAGQNVDIIRVHNVSKTKDAINFAKMIF